MLLGEHKHSIDGKGRVIVPAKFRDDLGETFVVTKGLDKCLFAYPKSEWAILEAKLKQLPLTNRDARKFVRFFFAGAVECEMDSQGRILLPTHLREFASLKKDIISIGAATRMEIWDLEAWKGYNDEDDYIDNDLEAKMEQFGI